ncbi:MAG: hypothetical protein DMG96_36850 [Acidobacteria bacterium]|nr:MAG: hypothetical protein DMG96_36850 [Acidobacteriota bacterium]
MLAPEGSFDFVAGADLRIGYRGQDDKVYYCFPECTAFSMSLIDRIKSWARLGRKKETPLISVVLLLRERIHLADELLHSAIVKAWGRDVREEDKEYVVNKPPVCFVKFEDIVLLINNVGKPYVTEEYKQRQASEEFREKRQLNAVMEHRAFFTVDLMHPKDPGGSVKQNCYRRMCALAAEFVDANCMAASFPETGHFRPYDGELKNVLRSDHPLKAVTQWEQVPVVMIEEDDAKLRGATEEARKRWPEFVAAFRERKADQPFSVKAPFRDGEDVEWMWVTVSGITEDAVEGSLGNAPVNLRNIGEGDHVRMPISSIADWGYLVGNKMIGGFSVEVLTRRKR